MARKAAAKAVVTAVEDLDEDLDELESEFEDDEIDEEDFEDDEEEEEEEEQVAEASSNDEDGGFDILSDEKLLDDAATPDAFKDGYYKVVATKVEPTTSDKGWNAFSFGFNPLRDPEEPAEGANVHGMGFFDWVPDGSATSGAPSVPPSWYQTRVRENLPAYMAVFDSKVLAPPTRLGKEGWVFNGKKIQKADLKECNKKAMKSVKATRTKMKKNSEAYLGTVAYVKVVTKKGEQRIAHVCTELPEGAALVEYEEWFK